MKLPDDYTIRLVDLPHGVGGFMSECPDGHVDVYINARWGHDAQLDATEHEFTHWENDDLYNDDDIQEVERRAERRTGEKTKGWKLVRARDLPRPMTKRRKQALEDLATLKRLGVLDNWDELPSDRYDAYHWRDCL